MTAPQALVFKAPLNFDDFAEHSHPVLRFWAAYGSFFSNTPANELLKSDTEPFYAQNCTAIQPDNSTLDGVKAVWPTFIDQYKPFVKVERDFLSIVVISHAGQDEHEIHGEVLLKVWAESADEAPVVIPQAFVYDVGAAEKGQGTHGYQFKQVRSFYDKSILDTAANRARSKLQGNY